MQKTVPYTVSAAIRRAFATGERTGPSHEKHAHWSSPAALVAAALASLLATSPAHAIGLGELQVQSGLGQALRANIAILGSDPASRPASCYSARLSTADGAFIVSPRVALAGAAGGTLSLSTSVAMAEPALSLLVEIACGDAVRKEFMLLLDPPLASIVPEVAARVVRPAPVPARRAAGPAIETPAAESAPVQAVATPPPTSPAEPAARPRRAAAVATTLPAPTRILQPASEKALAAAALAPKPTRNVLRMTARASSADADLINAIGLRLALADRLGGERSPPASGAATDAATLAADRLARARFAEALRGDTIADPALQATEQRLQQLQVKTRLLEKEAARLRQMAQQDAATRLAADQGNDKPLLAGMLALVVASLAAIALLVRRMRHLQRRDKDWNWEESVSASNARAMLQAGGAEADFHDAQSLEEEARAESTARAALHARAEAEARQLQQARESAQARAEANARHSLDDAFWEPAAPIASPVMVPVARPVVMPSTTWAVQPAAVSADLAELSMLTNTAGIQSMHAASAEPVLAASAPTSKPFTQALAPENDKSVEAAMPASIAPATQRELEPLAFLPDLAFPEALAMPLAFAPATTSHPTGLNIVAPLLPTATLAAPRPPASIAPAASDPGNLQFAEIRMQSTSVEEISDIMQEAEFWLSLHDLERAVEVLEPYATYEQAGSPLPWLYLFELYRDLGWEEKYDSLRSRFQRIFNGKALTWQEQQNVAHDAPQRGIEDVPHVALKLTTLWQSEEVLPYLESLLVDDRDGTRAGFDLPVYKEIMFLILLAYELQQAKQYLKPALGTPAASLPA